MTMARAHLVDVSVTRWYHCVTRCVRRALLLGEAPWNRKEWIERRLEELAEIFAVAVGGFAVMHNHLHVLLRLESRRNWLGSSSGWVLLRRPGATRWAIFGASVCWAASLRPAASNTTGNCQTTWCAAPGQLDGLSVALKRSSISKRGDPQSLDRPVRMLNPACTSPTSS